MLIGTFSALAVVSYDLSDPFRGSYQISGSVDQFYTIRDALRASAKIGAKTRSNKEKERLESPGDVTLGSESDDEVEKDAKNDLTTSTKVE